MEVLATAYRELVEGNDGGSGVTEEEKVRLLVSKGIAYLTQQLQQSATSTSSSGDPSSSTNGIDGSSSSNTNNNGTNQNSTNEETLKTNQTTADDLFTKATQIDQLSPMTWIGQGMLNLAQAPPTTPSSTHTPNPTPNKHHERARHFFQAALSDRGQILPALLGLALLSYHQNDYPTSIRFYSDAIRLFPNRSGPGARVGLGMACYQTKAMDRARACFRRAVEMDRGCVEGMIGLAVLDMGSLDKEYSKDYNSRMEWVV